MFLLLTDEGEYHTPMSRGMYNNIAYAIDMYNVLLNEKVYGKLALVSIGAMEYTTLKGDEDLTEQFARGD